MPKRRRQYEVLLVLEDVTQIPLSTCAFPFCKDCGAPCRYTETITKGFPALLPKVFC